MSTHVMPTYARLPVAFVRGEGAWLWDEAGKKYLDALAGIAVSGLGHGAPAPRAGDRGPGGEGHPHLEPLRDPAPDRARRPDLRAGGHGRGVLLQLRLGSERDRDQARAALRPPEQRPERRDHRDGARLARPHARDAVRDRQPQGAGRLRAARPRVHPGAVQRRARRPPGGRRQPEHRRRAGGSAAGRRRHPRRRSGLRPLPAAASATSGTGC